MKPILLVIALFSFFLDSCNSQKNSAQAVQETPADTDVKQITLSGQVANPAPGSSIKLFAIENNAPKEIANTNPDESGNFSFKIASGQPNFFLINFFGMQEQMLILADQDVSIKADGSNQKGLFEISGSRDTQLLRRYQQMEAQMSDQVNQFRQKFYTTDNREKVQQEYTVFMRQMIDSIKIFIDQADYSLAVIVPAMQLDADEQYEYLDNLSAKLNEKYSYNQMVSGFRQKIESVKKTAIGQVAPDIALQDTQGNTVSLSSLRGKFVLIDFWASWCGPCRQENPNVVRLYNQYKNKDFEIFGVSLDRSKEDWVGAIQKDGLTWVHVSDLKFWQSSVVSLYNIEGIPMTYLLDKNGVIIGKNLRGKALEDKLKELL